MRGYFNENNFGFHLLNGVSINQGRKRADAYIAREEVPFEKFETIFGPEVIRADKAYVANCDEHFKKGEKIDEYGSDSSRVLEAIFHLMAKKGLMNKANDIKPIKTNKYDDYHGIDEIFQIINPETSEEKMSMAIDVLSVGGGPLNVGIEKKMNKIQHDISSNHLPIVKYFFDEKTGKVGISDIPKVVIAADLKTIEDLNELWMERNIPEIVKHPLQIQIFEQIIEQAAAFSSFAKRNGRNEIAEKYDTVRMWAKKKISETSKYVRTDWNDNAFPVISNALYPFKDSKNFKSLEQH